MLNDAQGISLTAFRNACRRLGIEKWPYSRHRERTDEDPKDEGEIVCEHKTSLRCTKADDQMTVSSPPTPPSLSSSSSSSSLPRASSHGSLSATTLTSQSHSDSAILSSPLHSVVSPTAISTAAANVPHTQLPLGTGSYSAETRGGGNVAVQGVFETAATGAGQEAEHCQKTADGIFAQTGEAISLSSTFIEWYVTTNEGDEI
eukprot:375436-Hanusia_phi.AAC.2